MSFLGKLWDVTKKLGEGVIDKADEMQQTKMQLEGLGDDELARIAKDDGFMGRSLTERRIAEGILRSRGKEVV